MRNSHETRLQWLKCVGRSEFSRFRRDSSCQVTGSSVSVDRRKTKRRALRKITKSVRQNDTRHTGEMDVVRSIYGVEHVYTASAFLRNCRERGEKSQLRRDASGVTSSRIASTYFRYRIPRLSLTSFSPESFSLVPYFPLNLSACDTKVVRFARGSGASSLVRSREWLTGS